jgi:hypothetical protein
LNLNFETPEKQTAFIFQLNCFSAIVDFILGVCKASAEKIGVLNLFPSYFFLMLSSKRRFSNPAFKNSGSNPT